MYTFVRSGKASCCVLYVFLNESINILIKIHPFFHVLTVSSGSTDRNQAFGALGCADSSQRTQNLCRLISLRCFCRHQLNYKSRRCNLPASSQIVLVLFCIQTFDRHSDWFVDRMRSFDSDLTKYRMSYCCSVSFLHPILQ